MKLCDRFEREGLLRLEQGLPLDEHFETCPDCRAARAAYDRLRNEIALAGSRREPPAHWQARVWAAVERRSKRSSLSWRWLLAPGVAAAVAAVLLLVVGRAPEGPTFATLQVETETGGGAVRRGDEVHPGDRLILRATTGGARHAELRVYLHDTELVLRCSTEPPCIRHEDALEATLVLDALGSYQSLLLVSDRPLPEPSSGLDGDAGAALAAGAQVRLGEEVPVR